MVVLDFNGWSLVFYVVYNSHITVILSANDQNKHISFSEHTFVRPTTHTLTRTTRTHARTCPNSNHAAADLIFIVGHCFRLPSFVCSGDCDGIINFADPYYDCRLLLLLWYIFDEKENSIYKWFPICAIVPSQFLLYYWTGNKIEIHVVLYQNCLFLSSKQIVARSYQSSAKIKSQSSRPNLVQKSTKKLLTVCSEAANIDDILSEEKISEKFHFQFVIAFLLFAAHAEPMWVVYRNMFNISPWNVIEK